MGEERKTIPTGGGPGERGVLRRYILWYTLLFAAVAGAAFCSFALAGKSFVWMPDGLAQHFARLASLRRTVWDAAAALLRGEGWTFPLYDFHGGAAAPNTQIGFPQVLVFLWPWSVESFYSFHVLLNYYLAGLAFVFFGAYFRQKLLPVLTGAVTYVFCGFALYTGVRHPYFLTSMVLLPLLILGAEKIMRRERGWLLTGAVFLSVTASFGVYFSCMQAIFLFLYVCVRFFDLYEADRPRGFVRLWGRLLAWGGTGVLLGCASALPALVSILKSGRVGADIWDHADMFSYGSGYYAQFIARFAGAAEGTGHWMFTGFSTLCLPAVYLLFIRRERRERSLRVLFAVLTAMHMLPVVGYVMSGFSNISNRFCFGYAFCVAAIALFMLPHLQTLTRRQAAVLGALSAGHIAFCCWYAHAQGSIGGYGTAALLALSVGAVLACRFLGERLRKLLPQLCLLITCASVLCTALVLYHPRGGDYVAQFIGSPGETIGGGQYASLAGSGPVAGDSSFFRVAGDAATTTYDINCAALYGLRSLDGYPYYGQSGPFVRWLEELETNRLAVANVGFDHYIRLPVRDAAVASLAGVKYYTVRNGGPESWPYGFTEIDRATGGADTDVILENGNWLPLGYTYDKYMTREDYDALNALDKRQAQLQAVVLEQAPRSGDIIRADGLALTAEQVPCDIAAADGVSWADGVLTVERENGALTLSFEGLPETETYLRLVDMDLAPSGSEAKLWLSAAADGVISMGQWQADGYVYSTHQRTQLLDMGWSAEGMTSVTITFAVPGTFLLEDLQIWCQPMDAMEEQTAALRAEPLKDIETNWRGLTGTVSLSRDKILCLAIPWLDGWSARVDGQETELLHADTAFMAVEVPAGEHTVELRYRMPGLAAGLVLTGMGILALAGLAVSCRRRENERK